MSLWTNIAHLFWRPRSVVTPHGIDVKPAPVKAVVMHPVTKAASAVVVAGAAAWMTIATPFVASFEGYFSRAYRDPVGVETICYGITAGDLKYTGASFKGVYTKEECLNFLKKDLARYDNDLKRLLKADVYEKLPPHRHAALVSFDYNLGAGNLAHITPYFNAGNWRAGCHAMLAYHNAGGRSLPGLVRRRNAEYALCMRTD